MITAALAFFHVNRKFLTLVLVLIAGAAAYFWMEKAKADRAGLLAQAREICATSGEPFQPEGSKQADWGRRCNGRVAALVRFHAETVSGSNEVLRHALERQLGKSDADAVLAAIYAKQASEALTRMEAENAKVENDVVGAGYACALNDLAGLRADGC